jgi:hypothetical protein
MSWAKMLLVEAEILRNNDNGQMVNIHEFDAVNEIAMRSLEEERLSDFLHEKVYTEATKTYHFIEQKIATTLS